MHAALLGALCALAPADRGSGSLGPARHWLVQLDGPGAQLAAYEGRRGECWQRHVGMLQGGCGTGEVPLSGDARRRLAVSFANCQFEEDGVPTIPCHIEDPVSLCTAALHSSASNPHAYQVYSQHLLHVDIMCRHLADELIRREQRSSAAALLEAARRTQRGFDSLEADVLGVSAQVGSVRAELQQQAAAAAAAFESISQKQEGLLSGIAEAHAGVRSGFVQVSDTLGRHESHLEGLTTAAETTSQAIKHAQHMAERFSAQQEQFSEEARRQREDLGGIFAALRSLQDLQRSAAGSAAALGGALTYALLGALIYAVTALPSCAAQRLPLAALAAAALASEWLYDEYRYNPTSMTQEQRGAEISVMRWVYLAAGIAMLVNHWHRYRDPVERVLAAVDQLQKQVDQMQGGANLTAMQLLLGGLRGHPGASGDGAPALRAPSVGPRCAPSAEPA